MRHRTPRAFLVAAVVACSVAVAAQSSLEVLYTFPPVGSSPSPPLMQASDGTFYGTTQESGTSNFGMVFKMTPAGEVTVLHSFAGGANDGAIPHAALVEGRDGYFYGTTQQGGPTDVGVVYRIDAAGAFSILHAFHKSDGSTPFAALVQGSDGKLYGTTAAGGAANRGTAFSVTPGGSLVVLHSFTGGIEGASPSAALVQARTGEFYGTTFQGGISNMGTAFKMTGDGAVTVLHAFAGGADGSYPFAALLRGADGNFYGTTQQGGNSSNLGTVFRMTPSGAVTILHAFTGGTEGAYPSAALVQTSNGTFYGTTREGGPERGGTIFTMTSSGAVTFLRAFPNTGAGRLSSALIQARDGRLYGTTAHDGDAGRNGIIFRLTLDTDR